MELTENFSESFPAKQKEIIVLVEHTECTYHTELKYHGSFKAPEIVIVDTHKKENK